MILCSILANLRVFFFAEKRILSYGKKFLIRQKIIASIAKDEKNPVHVLVKTGNELPNSRFLSEQHNHYTRSVCVEGMATVNNCIW